MLFVSSRSLRMEFYSTWHLPSIVRSSISVNEQQHEQQQQQQQRHDKRTTWKSKLKDEQQEEHSHLSRTFISLSAGR